MITIGIPTKVEADPFDGHFSTIQVWQKGRWVCVGCKKPTKNYYLTCGDSRYDDSVPMCNCKHAKKIGKDAFDCEKAFNSASASSYYK